MIKILRLSDRIKLKMGKVTFFLAPLNNDKKREISSCTTMQAGEAVFDHGMAQHLYLKYSLKEVKGVKDFHNNDYELEFDGDYLTEECVSEVFMLPQKEVLMQCAWQVMNGIPSKLLDDDGKLLKGVALEVMQKAKPSG